MISKRMSAAALTVGLALSAMPGGTAQAVGPVTCLTCS